jgi:STE24 endopeptidase
MKKLLGLYTIYLTIIWGYFLFFYPLETFSSSNYAVYGHAMFFSTFPLDILFLYIVVKKKWLLTWVDRIESRITLNWAQAAVFAFFLTVAYGIIHFPFDLAWFWITHEKGIHHQPIWDWFYELGLDLLFFGVVLTIGIYGIRLVMGKFRKYWWLVLWLMALPIAVFFVYIQPIWIDPLYEDFTQLEEGPLREKIEGLTEQVGLEDATLLKVNMSQKTTTFNAYVTGIMGSARIVLWDTTLKGMSDEEILFILAHEIGHYVKKHVYFGVMGYILLSFALFFITAVIYQRVWQNLSDVKKYRRKSDLRSIPLLLLTFSILLSVTQPISLYVSRQMEQAADAYAIKHTKKLEPAVNAYHKMAIQSKSDIDPAMWVKWMRYSHPTIKDRIARVEQALHRRETK